MHLERRKVREWRMPLYGREMSWKRKDKALLVTPFKRQTSFVLFAHAIYSLDLNWFSFRAIGINSILTTTKKSRKFLLCCREVYRLG